MCSVQLRYLHPRRIREEKFLNSDQKDRIEGLMAIKLDIRETNRVERRCVVFRHPPTETEELHCSIPCVRVIAPGDPSQLFEPAETAPVSAEEQRESAEAMQPNEIATDGAELPLDYRHASSAREDIEMFRSLGLDADDDNEPVPENTPEPQDRNNAPSAPPSNGLKEDQTWGWNGIDPRQDRFKVNPSLMVPGMENTLSNVTIVQCFSLFLGWPIINMVTKATNANLQEHKQMDRGEFLRFLGMWLSMSTIGGGFNKMEYWSTTLPSAENGAPHRFNEWMSRHRFRDIMHAMRHADEAPPPCRDKFHGIRKSIAVWNDNVATVFRPGWLTCLDESMSMWHDKLSCPGWVFCPRKPHPFGNEHHSMCCGASGIMFDVELVEGKDRPKELPQPIGDEHGPAIGSLLRLTKLLCGAGKTVVLDSGFCVLKGIIELCKKGACSSALIEKRRYWPKGVPGKAMDERMVDKSIGATDAIEGKTEGVDCNLFMMKDKDFTIKLMSTCGKLDAQSDADEKVRCIEIEEGGRKVRRRIAFQHTEPFQNHCRCRHIADDHNHSRHLVPSIESTWVTNCWNDRPFQFITAISEVNAHKAHG